MEGSIQVHFSNELGGGQKLRRAAPRVSGRVQSEGCSVSARLRSFLRGDTRLSGSISEIILAVDPMESTRMKRKRRAMSYGAWRLNSAVGTQSMIHGRCCKRGRNETQMMPKQVAGMNKMENPSEDGSRGPVETEETWKKNENSSKKEPAQEQLISFDLK